MDAKIKMLIIFVIFSCVLCAQEEIDISKLAKEKATELEMQGWKVHAGSVSMYEQLYSAYAYEMYNDTHNPLQRLYTGTASDKFSCVISMLEEYALLDIQDWFYEYERSFRKHNAGLANLFIAGNITYSECICELDYAYDYKSNEIAHIEIRATNISDAFHSNYQSVIIPFVSLYRRNQDGSREEMLIAAFTDEFLENRRVRIPIFDNFGDCKENKITDSHPDDTGRDSLGLLEFLRPKKILNYETVTMEEVTEEVFSKSGEGNYKQHKIFTGMLEEERIVLLAEAEYILNE